MLLALHEEFQNFSAHNKRIYESEERTNKAIKHLVERNHQTEQEIRRILCALSGLDQRRAISNSHLGSRTKAPKCISIRYCRKARFCSQKYLSEEVLRLFLPQNPGFQISSPPWWFYWISTSQLQPKSLDMSVLQDEELLDTFDEWYSTYLGLPFLVSGLQGVHNNCQFPPESWAMLEGIVNSPKKR